MLNFVFYLLVMELCKYGIPNRTDYHYKNRIGILCKNALYQFQIAISVATKGPYCHALAWGQKVDKEINDLRAASDDYTGETTLSMFVCFKAEHIACEISELLSDTGEEVFATVWKTMPTLWHSQSWCCICVAWILWWTVRILA